MKSLLNTPPNPGAGSFLLQQDNMAIHPHQPKQVRTFLTREGSSAFTDPPEANGAGKNVRTFLQNLEQTPLAEGASESSTQPRTIRNDAVLSAFAGSNRTDSLLAPNTTPQPHSSDHTTTNTSFVETAYTTSGTGENTNTTSTMTDKPSKAVPPHRKPRPDPNQNTLSSGNDMKSEIRKKLVTDFGVNVSTPKPAKSFETNPWAANGKDESQKPWKPSPSTTTNEWGSKDWVEPDEPVFKGRGKSNAPLSTRGGRGRGREKEAPKSTRWPRKDDFPKPDPKRHETDWDCPPEREFSFASTAGAGWEPGDKTEGGANLGDWNTTWAPAPLDWESRSAFRPCQSVDLIHGWIKAVDETLGDAHEMPLQDFETVEGVTYTFGSSDKTKPDNPDTAYEQMGELVPHYWGPSNIENLPPQTFWQGHIRSDNPPPDDGIGLSDTKPWWEMIVRGGTFLKVAVQPPSKGINPTEENEEQRIKRSCDEGSKEAATRRVKYEKAKEQAKREKRRKKEENLKNLSIQPADSLDPATMDNRFKPDTEFKLLIRPAQETDMRDVRDLYNFYVDNSSVVPEMERRTIENMLEQLTDIRSRYLPFLVACEPGGPIRSRHKNHRRRDDDEPYIKPDRIVGFAFADDYNCASSIYRFTAEVEIFVKFDCLRQNIGKCLMDKLMAMLDPGYLERGNYPTSEELQNVSPDRHIKNIIINLPYDNHDKFTWQAGWLENWLGFKLEADMEHMGNKSGKPINLAIFKRTTAFQLNHAAPPIISPMDRHFS